MRVASAGASNARDWESICKIQIIKTARPTTVMKRDNTAKNWIVRWQFRGDELFHPQIATRNHAARRRLNFSMIPALKGLAMSPPK